MGVGAGAVGAGAGLAVGEPSVGGVGPETPRLPPGDADGEGPDASCVAAGAAALAGG